MFGVYPFGAPYFGQAPTGGTAPGAALTSVSTLSAGPIRTAFVAVSLASVSSLAAVGSGTTPPTAQLSLVALETLAKTDAPQQLSLVALEVLARVYPPFGEVDVSAPSGLALNLVPPHGEVDVSAPSNLGVGFAITPSEIDVSAPSGIALATRAVAGEIDVSAPGDLTVVTAGGTAQLEEIYVEAESQLTGSGLLDAVYVETGSIQRASARLDQLYVEVLTKITAIRLRPLRLTQRDDGLGVTEHARIQAGSLANAATSTQLGQVPRIGTNNRYS